MVIAVARLVIVNGNCGAKMSKPTPRPWTRVSNEVKPGRERSFVVDKIEDAAHIVKCVNMHDDLIEIAYAALKMHRIYCCQDQTEQELASDIGDAQARKTFAYNEWLESIIIKSTKGLDE